MTVSNLGMNVFVYGTLLVPEIWDRVTGLSGLVPRPAELAGYAIRRVRGAPYPGIVSTPGTLGTVPGKVFLDVPDTALRRLDAYEDPFYRREEVHPEVAGMGSPPPKPTSSPPNRPKPSCPTSPGPSNGSWRMSWNVFSVQFSVGGL